MLGINICKGVREKGWGRGSKLNACGLTKTSAGPTGSSGTGVDVRVALDGDKEVGPLYLLDGLGLSGKAKAGSPWRCNYEHQQPTLRTTK